MQPLDPAVVGLLQVAMGGVIGITGTVLTGFLTHRLSARSERKKRRLERLEEVVGLAYALGEWLDKDSHHTLFGKEAPKDPCPLLRIQTLCNLHFRELNVAMLELSSAARTYISKTATFSAAAVGCRPGHLPQAEYEDYKKEFPEIYGQFLLAQNNFVEEAAGVMGKIDAAGFGRILKQIRMRFSL